MPTIVRTLPAFAGRLAVAATLALVSAPGAAAQQRAAGPRFEISFSKDAHAAPITGRVYVAIARVGATGGRGGTPDPADRRDRRPALRRERRGPRGGQGRAIIDAATFGHPVQSLRDIPAGEYWVQPFVNVYTRFARADGHTVWLHMDQWEGQNWKRSPGNLYGDPVQITFDPKSDAPITLVADKVIPPVDVPADTDNVKRIKIQSTILTKWWGQPIYPRRRRCCCRRTTTSTPT